MGLFEVVGERLLCSCVCENGTHAHRARLNLALDEIRRVGSNQVKHSADVFERFHILRSKRFLLIYLFSFLLLKQIGEDLDQPEKWVPYLSVMQRFARLNSSAVALAISQNGNDFFCSYTNFKPTEVRLHKQKVGGQTATLCGGGAVTCWSSLTTFFHEISVPCLQKGKQ